MDILDLREMSYLFETFHQKVYEQQTGRCNANPPQTFREDEWGRSLLPRDFVTDLWQADRIGVILSTEPLQILWIDGKISSRGSKSIRKMEMKQVDAYKSDALWHRLTPEHGFLVLQELTAERLPGSTTEERLHDNYISAIKLLRDLTNLGLKDAKLTVDVIRGNIRRFGIGATAAALASKKVKEVS